MWYVLNIELIVRRRSLVSEFVARFDFVLSQLRQSVPKASEHELERYKKELADLTEERDSLIKRSTALTYEISDYKTDNKALRDEQSRNDETIQNLQHQMKCQKDDIATLAHEKEAHGKNAEKLVESEKKLIEEKKKLTEELSQTMSRYV